MSFRNRRSSQSSIHSSRRPKNSILSAQPSLSTLREADVHSQEPSLSDRGGLLKTQCLGRSIGEGSYAFDEKHSFFNSLHEVILLRSSVPLSGSPKLLIMSVIVEGRGQYPPNV